MDTVGITLKEKREAMGLSVDDVVKATKIDRLYIDAIEGSDFSFFEKQDFYLQVFVGSYAEFLGFDKNEVLKQLQEDKVNAKKVSAIKKEEPVSEQPVQTDLPNQIDTERIKSILPDYEVPEPAVATQALESVVVPKATSVSTMSSVEERPKENKPANDEINQLIQDINDNNEVNVDDYFDDNTASFVQESTIPEMSAPAQVNNEKPTDELLNSSIIDDIKEINEKDVPKDEFTNSLPEITLAKPTNDFAIDKSLESTAVIDLTSGIEIETINNQEMPVVTPSEIIDEAESEDVDEQPVAQATDLETEMPAQPVSEQPITSLDEVLNASDDEPKPANDFVNPFTQEIITGANENNQDDLANSKEASVLEELEKTFHNGEILNVDPDKTAMDLKIAKALGDTKDGLDKEIKKKVRRDRILDVILILLIVALIAYFVYKFIIGN